MNKIYSSCLALLLSSNLSLMAQNTDTTLFQDDSDFFELSLEELMNVKIVSASREEESSFDVPVSSFVISKAEIQYSGATNIPEALRLCPGAIVREVSNGTYDVSLRGGVDGYPAYNYSYINTTILVMIDNRPVFSSLQGGTYWQNLPVNITDVERIEIVHGPSSPLYGPNAVSGVINIITSRPDKEGVSASAMALGGTKTNILSANVSKSFNDKFSAQIGLGYEYRNRYNEEFYDPIREEYVELDSIKSTSIQANPGERFPNVGLSLTRFAGTTNLYYDHSEDVQFKIGSGFNHNTGIYPLSSGIAVANFTNISQNVDVSGKVKNFSFLAAYLSGKQGLSGNYNVNDYNYSNTDIYVDYNQSLWDGKINIRPAVSYQSAYVNDKEFTVDVNKSGNFNGEGRINNVSGSLKIDARPVKNLRVILAGRYDKFNYPDKGLFSYQGVLNYKIGEDHLVRLLTGKSYNGSFLVPTLINTNNVIGPGMELNLAGNNNLNLLSNTMYEFGFRTKVVKNLNFDIAVFTQKFTDFNTLVLYTPEFDFISKTLSFNFYTENLPLEINQQGVTVSAQANMLNSKIQFRPQFTFQSTSVENYSPYYNVKGAWDNPQFNYSLDGHKDSTYSVEGKATPSVWGGFNLIINPVKKLNIGISSYFFGDHIIHSGNESSTQSGAIKDQTGSSIASKFILNANVNYLLAPGLKGFINVRNLTDQASAEGFGSDKVGVQLMAGISLSY